MLAAIGRRPHVTSVMVTHDIRQAFTTSHRIGLLHGGRMRFVGTPAEFRASQDPIVR
jgi:phospholipid/cholesterol/gamma-HCH transport system ATP-binding protein